MNKGLNAFTFNPLLYCVFWCRLPESNWLPDDYKSTALPSELSRRNFYCFNQLISQSILENEIIDYFIILSEGFSNFFCGSMPTSATTLFSAVSGKGLTAASPKPAFFGSGAE